MIKVEEFMTAEIVTLGETDSLADARKIMTEKNIRHIPITDQHGHLLGLVTQRDVLAASGPESMRQRIAGENVSEDDVQLSEVMISDVSVISKLDSLRTAAMYMQAHKYGCLPVVSDNKLVGIITDSDFIAIAINLIEQAELNEEEIGIQDII